MLLASWLHASLYYNRFERRELLASKSRLSSSKHADCSITSQSDQALRLGSPLYVYGVDGLAQWLGPRLALLVVLADYHSP